MVTNDTTSKMRERILMKTILFHRSCKSPTRKKRKKKHQEHDTKNVEINI